MVEMDWESESKGSAQQQSYFPSPNRLQQLSTAGSDQTMGSKGPQQPPPVPPPSRTEPLSWVYINGLGERDIQKVSESDVLTNISFDKTGEYMAVGDHGGRVIVFRYTMLRNSRYFDYKYFSEFQSHEPEFDHLKSVELNEKINVLEFLYPSKQNATQLLSSNDRLIKLWGIDMKERKEVARRARVTTDGQLTLPELQTVSCQFEGTEKRKYENCHSYNINSLCTSPDGENFLSADALRINMWNIEKSMQAYQVVDLKPPNIDELSEVITSVQYNLRDPNRFLYSSSSGYFRVCDLRISTMNENNSQLFQVQQDPQRKHFFTTIISALSKAVFAPNNDQYIFSRDYLSVQIWDVRKTTQPVQSLYVTDYLEKRLCELYENERIFDKFDLQVSPDSSMVLTGSYFNHCHVIDLLKRSNATIDVRFMDKRGKQGSILRPYKGRRVQGALNLPQSVFDQLNQPKVDNKKKPMHNNYTKENANCDSASSDAGSELSSGDFSSKLITEEKWATKKKGSSAEADTEMKSTAKILPESQNTAQIITQGTWHPRENTFAVARHNSLFIFTEKRASSGNKKMQLKQLIMSDDAGSGQ